MKGSPRIDFPDSCINRAGVVESALVQKHYWPEHAERQGEYVAALASGKVGPSLRELIRMRSARTTGCTY